MVESCAELGQLIAAIQRGAADEVRAHWEAVVVVEEEALIAAGSQEGLSALGLACRDGQGEIVAVLLKHPLVDPNFAKKTTTTMMLAAGRGHAAICQKLLSHPRTDANLKRRDGVTALMLAVQQGHHDTTKTLLQHPRVRPSMKALFPERVTPLILAIRQQRREIVSLLLQCERLLTSENHWMRQTPLDYAKSLEGSRDALPASKDAVESEATQPSVVDLLEAFEKGGCRRVMELSSDRLYPPEQDTTNFEHELGLCESLLLLQLPLEASSMVEKLASSLRSRGVAPAISISC